MIIAGFSQHTVRGGTAGMGRRYRRCDRRRRPLQRAGTAKGRAAFESDFEMGHRHRRLRPRCVPAPGRGGAQYAWGIHRTGCGLRDGLRFEFRAPLAVDGSADEIRDLGQDTGQGAARDRPGHHRPGQHRPGGRQTYPRRWYGRQACRWPARKHCSRSRILSASTAI